MAGLSTRGELLRRNLRSLCKSCRRFPEVFVSNDGASWTIVVTRRDGWSCIVADWQSLPNPITGPFAWVAQQPAVSTDEAGTSCQFSLYPALGELPLLP